MGVLVLAGACAPGASAPPPPKAVTVTPAPTPPQVEQGDEAADDTGDDSKDWAHVPGHHEALSKLPTWAPADLKHRPPPANPKDIARAKKILEKALVFYRKGEYDKAEDLLKQAMAIYPFLAEANLVLGKIFLIRGSATLDRNLINNARLMFEMARTLDPNLHETDLLLELFQAAPPE